MPPLLKLRRSLHRHLRRIQHILNENAIPRGGIVYKHVRHRAHELAVLDNRRARQVCGQERTTVFNKKFIFARI